MAAIATNSGRGEVHIVRTRYWAVMPAQKGTFPGLAHLGWREWGWCATYAQDIIADCRRKGVVPFHKQLGLVPK